MPPSHCALVTTGDEVVEPGRTPAAGQIYDANGTLLEAAMTQAGLRVLRAGIATDNPRTLPGSCCGTRAPQRT